jgi:hypothetical protein
MLLRKVQFEGRVLRPHGPADHGLFLKKGRKTQRSKSAVFFLI